THGEKGRLPHGVQVRPCRQRWDAGPSSRGEQSSKPRRKAGGKHRNSVLTAVYEQQLDEDGDEKPCPRRERKTHPPRGGMSAERRRSCRWCEMRPRRRPRRCPW
ncbi:unnamed protein product, partial [Ectocarpus sp. 4 AP-2014]